MKKNWAMMILGSMLALTAFGCGGSTGQSTTGNTSDGGAGGAGQGGAAGMGGAELGGAAGMGGQGGSANVVVYPSPGDLAEVEHLEASTDYTVTVDGKSSFVYETDNYWMHVDRMSSDKAAFTYFDFDGDPVTVTVEANFAVQSVKIRPNNDGVSFTQKGNTITFTLTEPKQLAVEINDTSRPLFIFAEKPEMPDTTAQHYFKKGVHHIGAKYPIGPGERVHIEGGAVVEGTLMLGGDNIKIGGRGILTAGQWSWDEWLADKTLSLLTDSPSGTHFDHTYAGVVMLNSPGWFVNGYGRGKTISHLKVLAWVGNSDGPHLNGGGLFEHSFVFNNDDSLISNIGDDNVFRDNVVWKGPWGRPMISLQKNNQNGMLFEDIDVIHNETKASSWGSMSIIEAPGGTKTNYTFRDIRIEGPTKARMSYIDANQTKVSNILVENVTTEVMNTSEGFLSASNGGFVDGLTFHCINMNGTVPTNLAEAHTTMMGAVTNVSFTPCP